MAEKAFDTEWGEFYTGDSIEALQSEAFGHLKGKAQLILTSPPFPLNKKKSYGNLQGGEYLEWFAALAPLFASLLKPDGSLVIELGNAWEPKRPVQSLLPLQALLALANAGDGGLRLIQQFFCHNPARLPSPANWVTVNRIRLVDSHTHIWWYAVSDRPKADNRKVTRPYGKDMLKLLEKQAYNKGLRPSGHNVSEKGFLARHKGAISQSVFELEPIIPGTEPRLPSAFSFANTSSSDPYQKACKEANIVPHPARMPAGLASFFIQFLTDEGDLVLDPFAGSNTTGYVAERLGRRWTSFEIDDRYAAHCGLRFGQPVLAKGDQTP